MRAFVGRPDENLEYGLRHAPLVVYKSVRDPRAQEKDRERERKRENYWPPLIININIIYIYILYIIQKDYARLSSSLIVHQRDTQRINFTYYLQQLLLLYWLSYVLVVSLSSESALSNISTERVEPSSASRIE